MSSPDPRVTYHVRNWAAAGPDVTAALLVVHGLSEHSGRYLDFAASVTPAGFDVAAVDLYGHGESPGRRGHVRGFELDHLGAVDQLVRSAEQEAPGRPTFLVGHSLGGLVTARWVQTRVFARRLRGLVLITPFVAPRLHVPGWKLGLGRLFARIAPRVTLPTGIADDSVFRDPVVAADFAADPLVQRRISAGHWAELTRERQRLLEASGDVGIPTLVLLAGEDRIVSTEASQGFADRLEDCTVIEYPDAFHALHQDPVTPAMIRDLLAWARARAVDEPALSGSPRGPTFDRP